MSKSKSIWELVVKAVGVEEKLSKITGLSDKMSERITGAQDKVERFTGAIKKGFNEAASEIPGLEKAMKLVKNPIAAVVSVVGSLGIAFLRATNTASEFEHQFLELRQLNLEKPKKELDELNSLVLDTAWNAGISSVQMAKGYFDMQSATGQYGEELDEILTKTGQFSHATKANFDDLVNSIGKSTGMFGLNKDNIDDYLGSMAKTVTMGITTYDELAQVQADYLGAASMAGQGFDEGNKMFAAMTKVSKSAQEGATLTKTAFKGLIDPAVQKGLKDWGVSIFDAQGQMLGLDEITAKLAPKLSSMSDEDFSKFMGDVGGPDGMQTFLGLIKNNADEVLNTFEKFDNVQFDLDKALANAKGDPQALKNMVSNRMNVILTKLGKVFLPMVIKGLQWLLEVQSKVMGWWAENSAWIMDGIAGIGMAFNIIWLMVKPLVKGLGAVAVVMLAVAAATWLMASPVTMVILGIMALSAGISILWNRSEKFRGMVLGLKEVLLGLGSTIKDYVLTRIKELISGVSGIFGAIWKAVNGDWEGAMNAGKDALKDFAGADSEKIANEGGKKIGENFQKGYNDGVSQVKMNLGRESGAVKKITNSDYQNMLGVNGFGKTKSSTVADLFNGTAPGGDATNVDTKITEGLNTVSGGGKEVRNVTVTIGKLVENINLHASNVKEGAADIRDIIQEEIIKAVQGFETAVN